MTVYTCLRCTRTNLTPFKRVEQLCKEFTRFKIVTNLRFVVYEQLFMFVYLHVSAGLERLLHSCDLLHHLHAVDSQNRVAPTYNPVKNSRFAFMGFTWGTFGPPIKMQQELGTESAQVQTEGVTEWVNWGGRKDPVNKHWTSVSVAVA